MNKDEFYTFFIPALKEALSFDTINDGFFVKGPEWFYTVAESKKKEMDLFMDQIDDEDEFLNLVAYYFDAKSHGFNEINGVPLATIKRQLESEIFNYESSTATPKTL